MSLGFCRTKTNDSALDASNTSLLSVAMWVRIGTKSSRRRCAIVDWRLYLISVEWAICADLLWFPMRVVTLKPFQSTWLG